MIDLKDPNQAARLVVNTFSCDYLQQEVQIKTLKSHYCDIIAERAYDRASTLLSSIQPNLEKIERRVQTAIDKQPPMFLKQFINIPNNTVEPITVCLDINAVENTTWIDVISLLSSTNDLSVGTHEFGSTIQFGKDSPIKITIQEGTTQGFI